MAARQELEHATPPLWLSDKPDDAETPGRERLTDEARNLVEPRQRVEQGVASVEVDGTVLDDLVRLRVSKHSHLAKNNPLSKKRTCIFRPIRRGIRLGDDESERLLEATISIVSDNKRALPARDG